jgi:ribosomal protein L6P/L9E
LSDYLITKYKYRIISIPLNINVKLILRTFKTPIPCTFYSFYIENKENKENCVLSLPSFLDCIYVENDSQIKVFIKTTFLPYIQSKAILYTFSSKFKNTINGISALYRGTINIQGLGYTVSITKITKNKYNLFFRFGFKDKCNYIMPKGIIIENPELAKTKIIMYCKNIELLKKVQIQIQTLRKPKAFKLQGIYLNDIFPKVKKFVK